MPRSNFWSRGVPYVWGTGSMVILILLLLVGLLGIIVVNGFSQFWPHDLVQLSVRDGSSYLAQVVEKESAVTHGPAPFAARTKYEIGARDRYGLDFKWLVDSDVVSTRPDSGVVFERLKDGRLFGYLDGFATETGPHQGSRGRLWDEWQDAVKAARSDFERSRSLERKIARVYAPLNDLDRKVQAAGTVARLAQEGGKARLDELSTQRERLKTSVEQRVAPLHQEIDSLRNLDRQRSTYVVMADGTKWTVISSEVMKAYRPNQMSWWARVESFVGASVSFLTTWPREANTSGGILPAILGTVLMVLLMTVAVVPLGVIAALYLHEYAADSVFLRVVRLAVSNLAGVPSIVFGVFGLGFFVYFVGAGIDRMFFSEYLPSPTFGTGGLLWAALTLALLTVPVVIVATEEGLAAVPRAYRDGSLALGATRFQTIRKIVLPHAMPGVLTGLILAVSRGAGEVAPLMLTGVVPMVTDNPVDGVFPYVHLERKVMHLGFHIYDVGFQSPNVEAAKPLVYSTTLVLILLVVLLNALAIMMRNRLRNRARGASV